MIAYRRSLAIFRAGIPFLLGVGLCLRIVFMALTGHHDSLFIPWISYPIQQGHWYIYDYMASIRASETGKLVSINWTSNPPLSYYTLAAWMFFLRTTSLLDTTGWEITHYSAWSLRYIPRTLFLTKIIYLAADLGIWAILRGLLPVGRRRTFDLIWLLSPIILFCVYLMGQTDILATFWVVCALALAKRSIDGSRSHLWAALATSCLGVGAAYKLWPLLLLPLWAITLGRHWLKRGVLIVWGVAPFLMVIAPFLSSRAFRVSVVFGFGINFLQSDINSWFQSASPFIVAWGLAHVALIFACSARSFDILWKGALFILGAYFTLTTNWEFYWLVWLMPFLALAVAQFPGGFWLYGYICFYCLLSAINGWDSGPGFVLPLGDVFFNAVAAGAPRLRTVLFGGDDLLLRQATTIAFSLFVVAVWGLFALPSAQYWLPIQRPAPITKRRITYWEGFMLVGLLAAYAVTSSWIIISKSSIPADQFAASFRQTVGRDPLFFSLLVALIVLIGLGMLCSFVHLHRQTIRGDRASSSTEPAAATPTGVSQASVGPNLSISEGDP